MILMFIIEEELGIAVEVVRVKLGQRWTAIGSDFLQYEARELCLTYYLPIASGRSDGFIHFARALAPRPRFEHELSSPFPTVTLPI